MYEQSKQGTLFLLDTQSDESDQESDDSSDAERQAGNLLPLPRSNPNVTLATFGAGQEGSHRYGTEHPPGGADSANKDDVFSSLHPAMNVVEPQLKLVPRHPDATAGHRLLNASSDSESAAATPAVMTISGGRSSIKQAQASGSNWTQASGSTASETDE